LSAIKWVVMHDTEGGSAKGIAAYFQRAPTKDTGSTHLVIDDTSCYRCLRDNQIPWAAPGANTNGFHIELCGWAKWTSLVWSSHRAMLNRAAYKTAWHCKKFGIPPYFIKADALMKGTRGVTTHAECTKAFGGSHTDPGAGWPRWWFMRRVRHHYDAL
jgi:N-acetylmuramoyl-L-alanine amidase